MADSNKIGVIGAGGIGFNLTQSLARNGFDVFLYNRIHADANGKPSKEWVEKEGKVDDLNDALEHPVTLTPTLDDLNGAYAVVITAGATRKEGETRESLARRNAAIIKQYAPLAAQNPDTLVMVISNPVDGLTRYLIDTVVELSGRKFEDVARKIIGVSYVDTTRLRNLTRIFLEKHHPQLKRPTIEGLVLGEHGPTMVPVISQVKVNGKPLSDFATPAQIEGIVKGVVTRGNDIIVRTGTSAIAGPSIAVINMIKAMKTGKPVQFPCSAWDGTRCIGTLAEFKENNLVRTIPYPLNAKEQAQLDASGEALDKQYSAIREL